MALEEMKGKEPLVLQQSGMIAAEFVETGTFYNLE